MNMIRKGWIALAALAAVSTALFADDTEGEVETLLPQEKKGERLPYYHDENPLCVEHSIYSDIFIHKWLDAPRDGMEMIPQAEQDKICETFINHWRTKAQTLTDGDKKANALCRVGDALIYCERWAEAEETFRSVLTLTKSQQTLSRAWNGIAEAQLGAGKKAECLETIKEFLALKLKSGGYYNGGKSRHRSYHSTIYHAKYWLEPERWMNDLQMPRYTGNMAFPEAQEAEYSDSFVPCPKIAIKLVGVAPDDMRVRLLTSKLRHRGFESRFIDKKEACGSDYLLGIMLTDKAPVEKREGYSLDATAKGCVVKARDSQGVLWGIVSFLQILDPEGKRMRLCKVRDWPDCPRRGYYGRTWTSSCEFAVFNKMNYITHKPYYFTLANYNPFQVLCVTEECKTFNGLGLEFYGGCGNYTMDVAWPVCWKVFTAMQIDELKKWAKCGLNVYYPYDDARYWESSTYTKEERDSGLKPSQTDAKRIAEIYNAVKAEYPNFKMQFCPPFYWGPRAGHPYPDDRNRYLKSIAEFLPPEIDIIWTGERVGSHTKDRRDCKWFSSLIGRKPTLFQNKTGPHNYLSYVNDRTRWDKWFYPGFVTEDMAGIQKNSDTPGECPQISSLADYLWNVKAYDATRAIKRGLDNYAGKGVFETLEPAHKILCEYDKFHKYGKVHDGMRFKSVEQVSNDLQTVLAATAAAKPLMVSTNQFNHGMGAWNRAVGWMKNLYSYKRKHPNPRAEEEKWLANNEADAVKQCGYRKGSGDIYVDGYMFDGGFGHYIPSKSKRDWHPIATSRLVDGLEPRKSGVTVIPLKSAPTKPFKAVLSAFGSLGAFTVEVNGEKAYSGSKLKPKAGEDGAPKYIEFELPEKAFKAGDNAVRITNDSRSEMAIVYLLLRQ